MEVPAQENVINVITDHQIKMADLFIITVKTTSFGGGYV